MVCLAHRIPDRSFADRIEAFGTSIAALVAQYTAMDSNLSRLNALQSYVTQQITAMQARSGS